MECPPERGGVAAGSLGFKKSQSDDEERRGGRESREVALTSENNRPSSPTLSAERPPHSLRRFLSTGVPLPTYLIAGQDPRRMDDWSEENFVDEYFFFVFIIG